MVLAIIFWLDTSVCMHSRFHLICHPLYATKVMITMLEYSIVYRLSQYCHNLGNVLIKGGIYYHTQFPANKSYLKSYIRSYQDYWFHFLISLTFIPLHEVRSYMKILRKILRSCPGQWDKC